MKKKYIKPIVETFGYAPETGYATTVALKDKDYILVEGIDRGSLLSAEEVSEYTDASGEWTTGEWE